MNIEWRVHVTSYNTANTTFWTESELETAIREAIAQHRVVTSSPIIEIKFTRVTAIEE